jgi:hypothetical protein
MAKYVFLNLVTKTNGLLRDQRREKDFSELLLTIKEKNKAPNAVFNLDFKRALSDKKKYYSIIIFNDTQKMIESFIMEFPQNAIEEELIFSYNSLYQKIDKYLKSIARYIDENKISDDLKSDQSYILNYLKFSAIQLMLELQEQYGQYAKYDLFDFNEIHEKYFGDKPASNYLTKYKEVIKKKASTQKKTTINKSISFGFIYEDPIKFKQTLRKLCLRIDMINDNYTSFDDFFLLLTSNDYTKLDTKVHVMCQTTQFSYVMNRLKPYFKNLTPTSIANSEKFYTKTNTLFKAGNLYKNKSEIPKDKSNIDNILEQLK